MASGADAPGADLEDAFAAPADHEVGAVDDLATLTNLTEDSLLREIQARYDQDIIYTFVSDILIAVNPFKKLSIYTPDVAAQYNKCIPSFVPPHAWVIADECYQQMFSKKQDQCAVISGESGAGKTESAKLVIKHIISLCQERGGVSGLEQSIVEVSPILEAFGNAQTVMNDNSSRFGKYTRLLFNEAGAVMGVQISEYLLEKSRVVEQDPGERNFHVFYYLFADAALKEKYQLGDLKDFGNLQGELWDDNGAMFSEMVASLKTVGFSAEEDEMLYAVLSTVMHLANVDFDGTEESTIRPGTATEAVARAASLLGVKADELAAVLTTNVNVIRGETTTRHYKPAGAYDCRDALSKCLYGNLFGWVVGRINEMLAPELHQKKLAGGRPGQALAAKPAHEIGVLDIFGFENFETNSFEQVCINLAHEQLQYFFNRHTFKLELEEYVKEGIEVSAVTFKDNMDLITMFNGKPIGLLSLLDEESNFPKATDASMLEKFEQNFKDHESYVVPSKSRGYPAFGIRHFAGLVEYNCTNFLEKNRDNLAGGIVELMQDSSIEMVVAVFSGEILATGQIRVQKDGGAKMHRGEEVKGDGPTSKVHRKSPSLSSQFKVSLSQLIDRMTLCYPHFIRCIKPNLHQQPDNFIPVFVKQQLGYTGVLEATRIRQEGFSWRPTFAEFTQRYKILAFDNTKLSLVNPTAKNCVKIIEIAKLEKYHVGSTKLFLKFYHVTELEQKLKSYFNDVVTSQALFRGFFARKKFKRLLERKRMNEAQRAEHDRMLAEEAEANAAAAKVRQEEEERLERERMAHETELANLATTKTSEERALMEAKAQEASALLEIRQIEKSKNDEEAAKARAQQEAEMEALARAAAEARALKKQAEDEAKNLKRERAKSQKFRREEATRLATEAKVRAAAETAAHEEHLKAKEAIESTLKAEKQALEVKERQLLERLQKAEEDARRIKEASDKAAADAEQSRKDEEARFAAEEEAYRSEWESRDYRLATFDLEARIKKICALNSSDIELAPRTAKGYLNKMGGGFKNWHKRWFVVDVEGKTVKYFAGPTSATEKNGFMFEDITRCYIPKREKSALTHRTHASKKYLFVIETPQRTFYCEGLNEQSQQLWQTILNDFAEFNVHIEQGAGSKPGSLHGSPSKPV